MPQRIVFLAVLVVAMATVAMTTLLVPASLRAADSPAALSVYEQLIADVYPIQQNRWDLAKIDATPDEVAAIQSAVPVKTSNWENLGLGEFEPDAAFKQRQAEAQTQELRAYQQAVEGWKGELAAAEVRRANRLATRATIARRDLTPTLVAHDPEKPLGKIQRFSGHLRLALPTFDRALMGFDRVQLPADGNAVALIRQKAEHPRPINR